jgi:pimeloyl-ACP methyl ester carboxylesterase
VAWGEDKITGELTLLQNPPIQLTQECMDHIAQVKQKSDYQYAWVKSYEVPNNLNSTPIYIFTYFRIRAGQRPIALYNGGPMESSHSMFLYISSLPGLDHSYVFLDQRGTGCSSPFPYKTPEKVYDYGYWGTEGIVFDSERIRSALNIQKWDIWGQSYGAFIVQRYLEKYPESIRRAGGHGGGFVALPKSHASKTPLLDMRYENQYKLWIEYFKRYPESKEAILTILQNPNRCLLDAKNEINFVKETFLELFVKNNDWGFTKKWEVMNEMAIFFASGKRQLPIADCLAERRAKRRSLAKADQSKSMQKVDLNMVGYILGLERRNEDSRLVNSRKFQALAARELGDMAFSELTESAGGYEQCFYCRNYPDYVREFSRATGIKAISTERIRLNLEKFSSIEYTLWSGEFDPFLPRPILKRSAQQIGPRVNYVEIQGSGHDPYTPETLKFLAGGSLD